MATPDVRVRLSAEGVAEVVAALQKIQLQAVKTNSAVAASAGGSSAAFAALTRAASGAGRLLAAVGIAVTVAQLVAMTVSSSQAAESLGKTAQKAGGTAQAITMLSIASRTADLDNRQLVTGMGRFATKLTEMRAGVPAAVALFRSLGLGARDFRGKDLADSFIVVETAIGKLKTGTDKTAISMAFFGKQGQAFIPLANDIATRGIDPLAKAIAKGFSPQVIASTSEVNDKFRLMSASLQMAGANLVAGLGPAALGILNSLADLVARNATGFQNLGTGLGRFFALGYALIATFSSVVAWLIVLVGGGLATAWDAASLAMHRHFKEAGQRIADFVPRMRGQAAAIASGIGGAWSTVAQIWGKAPDGPPIELAPGGTGTADATELFRQRSEIIKSALENEQKLIALRLKFENEETQRAYDQQLIGIRAFYQQRRQAIVKESGAQIDALLRLVALERTNPDAQARRINLQKLGVQLAEESLKTQGALAQADVDERQKVLQLSEQRMTFEEKLMEAQGQRHAAAMIQIDDEVAKYDKLLAEQGMPASQRKTLTDHAREVLDAKENLSALEEQGKRAMDELARGRLAIERDVKSGAISELEGQDHIYALEQKRLGPLKAIADAIRTAAEATGDPDAIARANDFLDGVLDLTTHVDRLTQKIREFKRAAVDAFHSSLVDTLSQVGDQIRTIDDFWHTFVSDVLYGLRRIAAEALVNDLFNFLGSMFGGGKKATGKSLTSVTMASGGLVLGPGTPTSDSIPAMLSTGEFVVRAQAVSAPGALQLLQEINRGRHYAEGGLVAAPASHDLSGQLTIKLGDGLIPADIESPEGTRKLFRVLSSHPKTTRKSIGVD